MARVGYAPLRSPLTGPGGLTPVWERWFRDIGRVTETVSTKGIITVSGGETKDLDRAGLAINLVADTGVATVILPNATEDNKGETVTVTLTDATNNGIIQCKGSDTILGESTATLSIYGTTLDLMVQAIGKWVII